MVTDGDGRSKYNTHTYAVESTIIPASLIRSSNWCVQSLGSFDFLFYAVGWALAIGLARFLRQLALDTRQLSYELTSTRCIVISCRRERYLLTRQGPRQ